MNETRSAHLQRMHAVGNTIIVPTYRDALDARGVIVAAKYLGYRAKFAVRMRTPLIDNVTRIKIGDADSALVSLLVEALRPAAKRLT